MESRLALIIPQIQIFSPGEKIVQGFFGSVVTSPHERCLICVTYFIYIDSASFEECNWICFVCLSCCVNRGISIVVLNIKFSSIFIKLFYYLAITQKTSEMNWRKSIFISRFLINPIFYNISCANFSLFLRGTHIISQKNFLHLLLIIINNEFKN
jgi:hypothetical protein